MDNRYSVDRKRISLFISDRFISLFVFFVSFLWFFPLINQGIIMGDDISLFTHYSNITSKEFVTDVLFGYQSDLKYRPVNNIIQYVCITSFGNNYSLYVLFNILIISITAVLLYDTLKTISQNRYTSSILSILFIFFPSQYYNVTQLFGAMEAACVLFLVLSARYMTLYLKDGKLSSLWAAIIFGSLMFFTHERFIAIYPVYFFCILAQKKSKLTKTLAVYFIPVFLYLFVKMGILGLPFFQGTGGDTGSIEIGRIICFFARGFANLLGVNIGPEYLNGYTISNYSIVEVFLAFFSAAILIAFVLNLIRRNIVQTKDVNIRKKELFLFVLAALALGATLLSGCVTVRLEMRWLTAPFVIVLLYLGHIVSKFTRESIAKILVLIVCSTSVWNAFVYRTHLDMLYFVRAMNIGRSVYDATIRQYGESLANYNLVLCGNNELEWSVGELGDTIFDVYLEGNVNVEMVEDLKDLQTDSLNPEKTKAFVLNDSLTVDEFYIHGFQEVQDLYIEELHSVSPDTFADTPSGKGLCFLSESSFTLLSGYTDHLSAIDFPANAGLYLELGMPYDISDGAQVRITVLNQGDEVYANSIDTKPEEGRRLVISLDNDEPFRGEIILEVTSPSGDVNGDWVTFYRSAVLDMKS